MSDTATSGVQQVFRLKSASVSMTALELYYFDSDEFEETLRGKINQAPGFQDIPLVISLESTKVSTVSWISSKSSALAGAIIFT